MTKAKTTLLLSLAALSLAACSGGGGSAPTGPGPITSGPIGNPGQASPVPTQVPTTNPTPITNPTPTPISTPTPTPVSTLPPLTGKSVSGKVASLPVGAFGSGLVSGPVSNAIVVVGTVPLYGTFAPANLPVGDVATKTAADGTFSVTVPSDQIAPPSGTFIYPYNNMFGFNQPPSGYFVEVFAPGTDGISPGSSIPNHSFLAVNNGSVGTLRVTTASSNEAGYLALINSDRNTRGKSMVIFDETALEIARQHSSYLASNGLLCHYDALNRGPVTRYSFAGGLYDNRESIGYQPSSDSTLSYKDNEFAQIAEGPGGSHYDTLTAPGVIWMGTAVSTVGNFTATDVETSDSSISLQYVYPNSGMCPPGTIANNS